MEEDTQRRPRVLQDHVQSALPLPRLQGHKGSSELFGDNVRRAGNPAFNSKHKRHLSVHLHPSVSQEHEYEVVQEEERSEEQRVSVQRY